jgi:tetratricopeptide (TPR) repeat protein
VDKLVAKSWLQKAFYDNALHKAKEALQDIKNTAFPDEAAKDLAVAGVLETIALVDDDLGEYRDMIANEEQAVTLGDKIVEERYICSRYYTIRDYAASIRACTQAMDDGANPIEARFWRGMAYRDSGDADAAVKDWTIVAGLNSRYRSNAVIDMSMIYFGRNDYRGALDVLKKYDFLYDPGQSDKESVAIGYNNRCYAYMQLGQLKEALSDCTESLKYGSIPDAYDKQLKLMKRLNMPTPVL